MASDWWKSLSDEEKLAIALQAQKAQDETGHRTCYWCGASLDDQGHDYTSSVTDRREICKGFCKQRRFFDNPD